MLDTDILWRFFLLWLVIVPTPGANSLMVTHLSLTRPAMHVAFALGDQEAMGIASPADDAVRVVTTDPSP